MEPLAKVPMKVITGESYPSSYPGTRAAPDLIGGRRATELSRPYAQRFRRNSFRSLTCDDLPVDDGTMDLTAADNQVHIALALALRGEPKAKVAELAGRVESSKRKRAVTFWATAQSMLDGDASAFETRFKALVALYPAIRATG
jgi:hypothetical protein